MCAIIDKNVVFQAFGEKTTVAGKKFREWLESSQGMLVVGGGNLDELITNSNFSKWFSEAIRRGGWVRQVSRTDIDSARNNLNQNFTSNDEHVLALALASGARLLFTNDRDLQQDFGNTNILPHPSGQVYTTLIRNNGSFRHDGSFRNTHKQILVNAVALSPVAIPRCN